MSNFKLDTSPAQLVSAALNKSLSSGYNFGIDDVIAAEVRAVNKPRLLTQLFGGSELSVNTHATNSFVYDFVNITAQLPAGKSYTGKGPDLSKDSHTQKSFVIPSFGLTWNVLPQDFMNKRKPGGASGEFMTAEYIVSLMQEKASTSWDLFNELAIAKLITDDQNIIQNGPGIQYTWHTEIFGTSRPVAAFMNLAGTTELANRVAMIDYRRLLEQRAAQGNRSIRGVVCVCGDDFFTQRMTLEEQSGLARDMRSAMDIASQRVPELTSGTATYDSFTGLDNVTYIRYGSEVIGGTKLIADDKAYLIALGAENVMSIELAPAVTMSTVNQEAQAMYMWAKQDERLGIMTEIESNRLFFNKAPDLIIALDKDAS